MSAPATTREPAPAGDRSGRSSLRVLAVRPWRLLDRHLPWWAECGIAVGFYLLYDVVQAATTGGIAAAGTHGLDVVHAERDLHVWVEPSLNRFVTAHDWLGVTAGYSYALMHVVVTATVLGYLWWRHPVLQVRLRNALLVLSLLALVVYGLYPVSPPRLAVGGLTDTLVSHDILGAAHVHQGLVNLYAAMPSLHVAWACWCAGALTLALRSRWRYLAWLYPLYLTWVVVATANHYLLDAVAGALFAAVALAVVSVRSRRSAGSPGSSTSSRPIPSPPR